MNRPRILLADDNNLLLERVKEHLASAFDVVGIAHDGGGLVAEALRLHPDVIVVDIVMPGLTGVEAVHQLRVAGLTARAVFLTVHSEAEFLHACLEEGALGYVVKSHMGTDLIPAIRCALEGKLFVSPARTLSRNRL
jgi:DNA-binding NarL/FixJ family response regulator